MFPGGSEESFQVMVPSCISPSPLASSLSVTSSGLWVDGKRRERKKEV